MSPYPTSPSVFPRSMLISNLSHTLSSRLRMQRGTCFVKWSAAARAYSASDDEKAPRPFETGTSAPRPVESGPLRSGASESTPA